MYFELKNKQVKTKKTRDCSWCGELINKGDDCRYRAGPDGGDFLTDYQHIECYQAMCDTDWSDNYDGSFEYACSKRGQPIDWENY